MKMKKENKILMDKKVINLIDNKDNLEYVLKENEMLIINIFQNSFNSLNIKTIQNNNSYLVINYSGFVKKDTIINIDSEILGSNNTCLINFRALASLNQGEVFVKVHVLENTFNNRVREDLKGLLENGTLNLMPILEIDTSEVKADHFATIGHYPLEELFYLETKGISYNDAIKLLKKSFLFNLFAEDFLGQINWERIQDE